MRDKGFRILTAAIIMFVMVGCAGLTGKTVVPKTTGEKLAYAEATLTGLTLATIKLNEARLIPLEKVKKFEIIITSAELSLKLGRLALMVHNAEGAIKQLDAVTDILIELNSFVELKRRDYADRPLPVNGNPVPIPESVPAGGGS